MPPCARATVGQSWERSWPPSTKRYSVCLPSPDRELPSRGSLHSSSTRGSGLPSSTLCSLVLSLNFVQSSDSENECITATTCHFTPALGLAALGAVLEQRKVFEPLRAQVQIEQKTVKPTSLDKLSDSFITLLAGAHGLVAINTLLRANPSLQCAFGRKQCAEQSVVQHTLDACTPRQAAQLEQALDEIYRTHRRGSRHDYRVDWHILDGDLCGWLCGKQAAFATKGDFAHTARNARRRQLGRVLAWHYQEVIVDRLFPGNCQLNATLQTFVSAAQNTFH